MKAEIKAGWIGLSLCVLAALGASSGGVFVRIIGEEAEWAVLFYRSAAFSLVVLSYLFIVKSENSSKTRRYAPHIKPSFLAAALFLGLAFIFYVIAMNRTTVGNVLLILSAAPFSIALIRRFFFGATISGGTWTSMVVGGAGVVIVVTGGATVSFEPGIIFALGATLCYSGFVVCLGIQDGSDFMWSIFFAGIFAAAISALISIYSSSISIFAVSPLIVGYASLMGIFQLAVQYILMTKAASYIPPETISLVLLLEVVLGPVWVWFLFGETLSHAALLAFPLILGAAIGNVLVGGGRGRRRIRRPEA